MNKLKGDCFSGHDTRVFDSSRLQEGIFVYTLVKLYNKADKSYNVGQKVSQLYITICFATETYLSAELHIN